jgi:hypothetical protein
MATARCADHAAHDAHHVPAAAVVTLALVYLQPAALSRWRRWDRQQQHPPTAADLRAGH